MTWVIAMRARYHSRARTTFAKGMSLQAALQKVISGVASALEFSRVLVGQAVEDVLQRVAADHNLDFAALVAAYKAPVVECVASLACPASDIKCTFTCKRSQKVCGRPAAHDTFCASHFKAGAEEASKRRRIESVRQRAAAPVERLPAPAHADIDPLTLL